MSAQQETLPIAVPECDACGAAIARPSDSFCRACGAGRGLHWSVLAAVPASLVAALVTVMGRAAPHLVSTAWTTTPGDGLLHEWREIVVPSAVVALPWLYAGVAGWTAVVARPSRSMRSALAAVALGTIAVVGTTLLAGSLAPGSSSELDLLIVAAVTAAGALLGWGLGSRAARATGTTRLAEWTRGSPVGRLALGLALAHAAVVLGLVVYALAIAAIWLACVAATVILVIRVAWHAMFGSSEGRVIVRRPTWGGLGEDQEEEYLDGQLVRTATEEAGIFGGKTKTHRDAAGNVIAIDEEKESWLTGEKHVEHLGADGSKQGETRTKDPLFGEKYSETRDASGAIVAETRAKESILGEHYVETTAADGSVVGRAHVDEPVLGGPRVIVEGETARGRLGRSEKDDES